MYLKKSQTKIIMKKKQSRHLFLFSISICLLNFSCKKESNTPQNDFNVPNATCVLTKSSDDLFGNVFELSYDANGKITSAFAIPVEYDNLNRFKKIESLYTIFTYNYASSNFLPTEEIYDAKFNATDSGNRRFYYNTNGQLIKEDVYVNTASVGITIYSDTLTYNAAGNVILISRKQNGTNTTVYEGISFDNKQNPHKSNQWIVQLFRHVGDDPFTYLYRNNNNATSWKLIDFGTQYNCTVTYTYNAKNFPLTIHTQGICPADPSLNFERTETMEYTCQ